MKMLVRPIRLSLAAAARHFSEVAVAVAERSVAAVGEVQVEVIRNDGRGGTFLESEVGKKAVAPAEEGKALRTCGRPDSLARRLFSLVYAKRSSVVTIRKWKEEGHVVRKYELNRIVRELRKLRRYKHALELCEWMMQQKDIELQPGDYAVHLDLISKIRGVSSAEKFFEDLPDTMRGQPACSALLHTYVQHNLVDKAEALMEKMSECGFLKNALPYNHMLSLYIANGQLKLVPGMIKKLKENTKPDVVTYNMWLTACASQDDVETAEKVFAELRTSKVLPDWVTFSILTNLYVKGGCFDKAASSLMEMEKRASRKNRLAYSSLLSLHGNTKNKGGLFRMWKKMKSLFHKLCDSEYMSMISALVKLGEFGEVDKIYGEWESVSSTGDPRIPNILLASYINKNQMEEAEIFCNKVVEKGITPCYTTWELLTWGHLKEKNMEKVLDYFGKAVSSVKKWNPDKRLIGEVTMVLEEQANIDGAEQFLAILREAGHVSTMIYNSVLRTYAKAGKMPLIIAERMKNDNVELDDETHKLIEITSDMCVSDVSSNFSQGR